jgi:hypothetical protein
MRLDRRPEWTKKCWFGKAPRNSGPLIPLVSSGPGAADLLGVGGDGRGRKSVHFDEPIVMAVSRGRSCGLLNKKDGKTKILDRWRLIKSDHGERSPLTKKTLCREL